MEANCEIQKVDMGGDADCTRFFDLFVAMCNHVDDIVDISWVSYIS